MTTKTITALIDDSGHVHAVGTGERTNDYTPTCDEIRAPYDLRQVTAPADTQLADTLVHDYGCDVWRRI